MLPDWRYERRHRVRTRSADPRLWLCKCLVRRSDTATPRAASSSADTQSDYRNCARPRWRRVSVYGMASVAKKVAASPNDKITRYTAPPNQNLITVLNHPWRYTRRIDKKI